MSTALDAVSARVATYQTPISPPATLPLWKYYLPSIQARLTALQLLTHDVSSLLIKACLPGCGPDVWPEHTALVDGIALTAAHVLKRVIDAVKSAGPAKDVFNLASFLEGRIVALGPGCETIELALRAVGEAGSGTGLGRVGLVASDLEWLRGGLLQASAASTSAGEQLRALDAGMQWLARAGPEGNGSLEVNGRARVAQAMVEQALLSITND